jgi:hypothetical protein
LGSSTAKFLSAAARVRAAAIHCSTLRVLSSSAFFQMAETMPSSDFPWILLTRSYRHAKHKGGYRSHFGSRFVIRLMRFASLFCFADPDLGRPCISGSVYFGLQIALDLRARKPRASPKWEELNVDCARTGSLLKCFPCFVSDRIDKLSHPR